MKTKVKLSIFLFFGLVSLIYVFPFIFVEAAKLESGVTIKEAAPPTNEICYNNIDDNGNGAIDENCQRCGLQIVSGVPINYGQLNLGQGSAEQKVMIKNEGSPIISAKIMIKGGNWISDAAGNPTVSGPELTHVSMMETRSIHPLLYNDHMPLTSNGSQLGRMFGLDIIPIYFQVWIPGSFSGFGSLHQEVTIDLLC